MTTKSRASVFDGEDIDVSDFSPKLVATGANRDQVRAVAEPTSFRSREPTAPPPKREPRRHRTGRNVQLNLKVRQEDADAFYALADEKGWVLGEAFQMAVEALRKVTAS
jgi:hypothetical protein